MPAAVYRKRDLIVTRRITDEVVLVPIRRGSGDLEHIVKLNEVGAAIWELIDGERDVEAIQAALGETWDADPDELARDVPAFLAELAANELLE